ncbi:hypothetical protein F5148DRAFT_1376995 [Russula earlei]|uniref:Uncharacterized protein n=1 Tax=Russula earlei TaxID=71964 RepID=A0ACC0U5U6_9AGAM|nr:hypothetical protein F5148DRAFT_1376995 [Russula earlei]
MNHISLLIPIEDSLLAINNKNCSTRYRLPTPFPHQPSLFTIRMRASAVLAFICLAIGVAPSFSLPSDSHRVDPSTIADPQNLDGHVGTSASNDHKREGSEWFRKRREVRVNKLDAEARRKALKLEMRKRGNFYREKNKIPKCPNSSLPIRDMSDLSPADRFRSLFEAALDDYEKRTGTKLVDHPLSMRLMTCRSVESITAVLQEQVQAFRKFRGDDSKLMKSLKCTVHVLHSLSNSTLLGEAIGIPFPPARAVFAGLAILLGAIKDMDAGYKALADLLESIEHFLNRLDIYTRIPPTAAMAEILVKIIVELLSTLGLVTKQMKQKRAIKFVKKIFGENDVEAALQRLDRLTRDEALAAAVQTLNFVHGLDQNMRTVLENGKATADSIWEALRGIFMEH